MKQLERKTAIVTGGAAGFGAGIVRRFVEPGERVVRADLDAPEGEAPARQLGAVTGFARCDVAAGRT